VKLTKVQKKALQNIADDEGHIGYWYEGSGRWVTDIPNCSEDTFNALLGHGFLKFVPNDQIQFWDTTGIRWYGITEAGYEALK
jgi:hypothetical protein